MDNATKAFAQKIISEIEKINHTLRDAPWKQHENTVSGTTQTPQKDKTESIRADAPKEFGQAPVNANNSNQQRTQTVPWWERGLKTLGIVAGITYAAIAYFQWKDARENFRVDQRAWVSPRIDKAALKSTEGEPLTVPVVFMNSGKTPAKTISGSLVLSLVYRGSAPDFEYSPGHPRLCFGISVLERIPQYPIIGSA
jgi:hypothetical protein